MTTDTQPLKKARKPAAAKVAKTPAEETFKADRHPLDCWPDILELAQNGTADLAKEWSFRLRWFGLFWEGPRSDTFMLRIKIHGGQLSSSQLSGICDLTERHGLPFLDITTRQGIQIRGIPIANVPPLFEGLEALGLTSMGAGADNIRNLTACPQSGIAPDELADVSGLVGELTTLFIGNREFSNLPRKFNISVAGCGTNCTHPELHDIAIQAAEDAHGNIGYTLRVGGQPSTSHFVSRDLAVWLSEGEVPEVCAAIAAVFREHGDRSSRKKARMGHLIDNWGMEKFRSAVEAELGRSLPQVVSDFAIKDQEKDPIGLHPQKQAALNFVGLSFPVGRVTLEQGRAMARLAVEYGSGELRTTNRQNILIINVDDSYTDALLSALDAAGLPYGGSTLRAGVTACSGNTYCKLATIETKQRVVNIVEHLEAEGLADHHLNIALSACPNTCANHSVSDIGLQGCKTKQDGKTVEAFNVFYGGATGDHMAFAEQTFKQVPGDRINDYLAYGVKVYKRRRHHSGESYAAFCKRHGSATLERMCEPQVSPKNPALRWLAERVLRLSGDRWTTYV